MTSESTRFLGQPNETKPTVGAVGWEDLLTLLLYPDSNSAAASVELVQPSVRNGSTCTAALFLEWFGLDSGGRQNTLRVR